MRFRLVEGPNDKSQEFNIGWPPSRQMLDAYDQLLTREEQLKFLKDNVLSQKTFKRLSGIESLIIQSIMEFRLNPRKNLFLDFITKFPYEIYDKSYLPKMKYIYESFKNKKLDIHLPVLKNPSLYDRDEKEFKYTLNAFNLCLSGKISSYIKNTKVVNVNEFLLSGNNLELSTIKEGGSDGRQGDTIFNVIEGWAKDNEYSPEEIAKNKEKDKDKDKDTKDKLSIYQSIFKNIEWSYEYFKDELEKIFANRSKFEVSLGSKDEYLNRVFATFTLPTLEMEESENKLYKKSTNDIKDTDVSKFGDPHKVDTPIPLKVRTDKGEIPGVYAFHQFIPLDENSLDYYKQVANKNMGNLKRHLNKITPNSDNDVDVHLQSIIDAIGSLQEISHK